MYYLTYTSSHIQNQKFDPLKKINWTSPNKNPAFKRHE